MTHCERLSDRIPDVALGRSTWSTEEQAHLDACPDCRAEWELVTMTARLGGSLPRLSDPGDMAATLLGRLTRERAIVRARGRRWLAAGLAAAAVTIIAVRIPRAPSGETSTRPGPEAPRPVSPTTTPSVASTGAVVALPELDGLPDAELESILGSLDETAAPPSFDGSGFDQPDDHELEQALEAWEG